MYKRYKDGGVVEESLLVALDFREGGYEQAPVVDVDSIMWEVSEMIVFQLINTVQNKTFWNRCRTGSSRIFLLCIR